MQTLTNSYLAEWQVYNIDASSENYMSEKKMQNAIEYIMKRFESGLTEDVKEQLSIAYKMDTQENRLAAFRDSAKIAVLEYTVRQNAEHDNASDAIRNFNTFE